MGGFATKGTKFLASHKEVPLLTVMYINNVVAIIDQVLYSFFSHFSTLSLLVIIISQLYSRIVKYRLRGQVNRQMVKFVTYLIVSSDTSTLRLLGKQINYTKLIFLYYFIVEI